VSEETQELLCLTRAVGTFSEDRPLGWDPVARRAIGRAMEWPDSRPKRNVPAARAASREKVKLKNLQIFQFYKI
jgi:hypothetical protein